MYQLDNNRQFLDNIYNVLGIYAMFMTIDTMDLAMASLISTITSCTLQYAYALIAFHRLFCLLLKFIGVIEVSKAAHTANF